VVSKSHYSDYIGAMVVLPQSPQSAAGGTRKPLALTLSSFSTIVVNVVFIKHISGHAGNTPDILAHHGLVTVWHSNPARVLVHNDTANQCQDDQRCQPSRWRNQEIARSVPAWAVQGTHG
jgi:hypothetical protein